MIQYQLAEHITDLKLRERLFMSPDDLLLSNVAIRRDATAHWPCGNCSPSSHSMRTPVCPATGQRCQRCGKLNHFSKVCHSAPANIRPQRRASSPTTIHSVGSYATPFKRCTVELDGVCLPLLLDTAASKSLLN